MLTLQYKDSAPHTDTACIPALHVAMKHAHVAARVHAFVHAPSTCSVTPRTFAY